MVIQITICYSQNPGDAKNNLADYLYDIIDYLSSDVIKVSFSKDFGVTLFLSYFTL